MELYQETSTSSRNGHFIKKWPHHQEMATSSRNGHFIKKGPLHQEMATSLRNGHFIKFLILTEKHEGMSQQT